MAHLIPVKHYYGGSVSALSMHPTSPSVSVNPNSIINLLNSCLVEGFGEVNVASISIDSAGIATVTSPAHGYDKPETPILISGASQEAINGEWTIQSTTTNTITFNAQDSNLINTTITGVGIKLKVPPLGWSRVFNDSGSSVSVYRSNDPFSRRHFLRVDDIDGVSVTNRATYFRGYETLNSTLDSGVYAYPPKSAFSRGLMLIRSIYSTPGVYSQTDNISWTLVGTSKQFYLNIHTTYGNINSNRACMFFGDLNSYVPGDFGASALMGQITNISSSGLGCFAISDYTGQYTSRNSSGLHTLTPQRYKFINAAIFGAAGSSIIGSSFAGSVVEPDLYSNKTILMRPILISDEANSTYIRGEMPGLSIPINSIINLPTRLEPNTIIRVKGERMIYIPISTWSAIYGCFLLSLDKDWSIQLA